MIHLVIWWVLVTFLSLSSEAFLESELWDDSEGQVHGQKFFEQPLPISYMDPADLPLNFDWRNVGGRSFLTKSLNQHIPQYCGSCWAHASMSTLADRIKIARMGEGTDINLSIQYILNCGHEIAGSCHGGSMLKTFAWIHNSSGFVPYDTCQPYLACSEESNEGFCRYVNTSCSPINICRTCTPAGDCYELESYPNATIAEYGSYHDDIDAVKAEIFVRGPVTAGLYGKALKNYKGGIFDDITAVRKSTHAVSIVGWGVEERSRRSFWIIRNSWGEYWGELGFGKILMGQNVLGIESHIVWATPGRFSIPNLHGSSSVHSVRYQDPSRNTESVQKRLIHELNDYETA